MVKVVKFMKMEVNMRKGFTLIELMIVIAIIIILTSIAVYNYIVLTRRARLARAYEDLSVVAYYLEMFRIDWGGLPCFS